MLKIILILNMGLILPTGLFAGDKLTFGMIGTFAIPFYTGSGYYNYLDDVRLESSAVSILNNPIIGISLGPTVEYSFTPRFSIQTELLLSTAGGGYVLDLGDETKAHLISEINLDIPVMLKYRIPLKKGRWLYFMEGPQLSILLTESETVQNGEVYHTYNNGRGSYNAPGFGALTVLGWQAEMKRVNILLELRYSREFTNSIKNIGSNYQNVISIGTGLKFGTEGKSR